VDVVYRAATLADADAICHHRVATFLAIGRSAVDVAEMREPFRQWLLPRLADGSYFGIMAEIEGQSIGHAGVIVIAWPPGPLHPHTPDQGNVLNVHVERAFRRRGIGRELMVRVEQMMRERGLRFGKLQASDDGRPLYLGLGWTPTNDLRKMLD